MATEAILSLSLRSEAIRGMCKGVRAGIVAERLRKFLPCCVCLRVSLMRCTLGVNGERAESGKE